MFSLSHVLNAIEVIWRTSMTLVGLLIVNYFSPAQLTIQLFSGMLRKVCYSFPVIVIHCS